MRTSWIPYAILAVALLLTGLATRYVAETTASRERLNFERTTESIGLHLQGRMATYIALLRGTRGLFMASDEVSRKAFARYFGELRLTDQFRGALGIGFARRILPGERESVLAARRAEGAPDFHIWQATPGREECVIFYLQPPSSVNQAGLGYNMYADAIRREAMITARDTGTPALSGRVTLAVEIEGEKQPGFLIYLPVYRGSEAPASLPERRESLAGYVFSAFRASDLLRTIASTRQTRDVSYAIYDGGGTRTEDLLFQTPDFADSKEHAGHLRSVTYASVARRTWTIEFLSTAAFDARSDQHIAPLTAYAGVLVSLMIFAATLSLARARQQAEVVARELEISRAEAQTANRLKDEFLATVSHELRTPLNAISGWTQLLLEENGVDEETRRGLAVIDRNASALATLVDELLDVSRIISGRLRLQVERADFVRIVEGAIETVQTAADARQIRIERSFPAAAPLIGDASRLQQVAWNLLSNSIKFSEVGGRLAVAIAVKESDLELRVTDFGKGISPEFLAHVFSPFRQEDSGSTRQRGGLGLGLAIVKRLVELHGGSVSAESEGEGRGATFRVKLPAGVKRPADENTPLPPPTGREAESGTETPASIEGVRILLVEDEADTRAMMEIVLRQRGAVVHSAASAAEALDLLLGERVDVIVSDIGMPAMDGLKMIEEIRRRPRSGDLPAIAVTAYATRADRERALAAGYDDHLPKPINVPRLQNALARLARRTE